MTTFPGVNAPTDRFQIINGLAANKGKYLKQILTYSEAMSNLVTLNIKIKLTPAACVASKSAILIPQSPYTPWSHYRFSLFQSTFSKKDGTMSKYYNDERYDTTKPGCLLYFNEVNGKDKNTGTTDPNKPWQVIKKPMMQQILFGQ
ncbi:11946_t:CDS:2, partial [Gigaspora rosea]